MRKKSNFSIKSSRPRSYPKIEKMKRVLFLSMFILIFIVFEYLTRDYLYSISISFMKTHFNDLSYCDMYEKFAFFELTEGRFLIIVIVMNLKNIFDAFLIILLTESSIFLNGVLKLIYTSPRPFWVESGLTPCTCATNYGNPSTASIIITVIFLSLSRIGQMKHNIYDKDAEERYKNIYNLSLKIFCYSVILITCFSRFAQNVHTLNQLLYGFVIGWSVFYTAFEIFDIDFTYREKIEWLIEKRTYLYTISIFLSMFILVNLAHSMINFDFEEIWLERILLFTNFKPNDFFDNESYQKSFSAIFIISAYTGIMMEYKFTFDTDKDKFLKYNIEKEKSNEKEYLWSYIDQTDNSFGYLCLIVRILFMYFISYGFAWIFKVSNPEKDPFFTEIFFNYFLPNLIIGISLFFFSKVISRKVGLTSDATIEWFNSVKEDDES